MDFDPLSLYTPSPTPNPHDVDVTPVPRPTVTKQDLPITPEEDDSHLQPLHTLDLPHLSLQPPFQVLDTLLKLLAPNEVLNFGDTTAHVPVAPETVFQEKGIFDIGESTLLWLQTYCPRLDTITKLSHVPTLSGSLKLAHTATYNAYLTSIIISPLSWLRDPESIDHIHGLASLRISENCGRTAQPELTRRIQLAGLPGGHLTLREPSLTSDNLGLKTWGSSLVLAQRLLKDECERRYLRGEVLELGSGTGLVGMVCSTLDHTAYLTDLPEIVPNLKSNVVLNGLDLIVHELDWTDPGEFVKEFGEVRFLTIVLSDPIYSAKHPYWVVNMIERFLDKEDGDARVLIQIPLRPKFEAERQLLWDLLEKRGLRTGLTISGK
ncbi:Protein-lysine N-methyltransferase EFM2 [Candida viswanathii]|uniref:Protein-lysine N-methyltransferase EFM2 n=1 Tax=Candida viswanathii TaxID=5486 RepID=A0A367XNV9_9ASCO|nr:Protein-lysine N-methyltransferase EFM2 [Candida viswanathii]